MHGWPRSSPIRFHEAFVAKVPVRGGNYVYWEKHLFKVVYSLVKPYGSNYGVTRIYIFPKNRWRYPIWALSRSTWRTNWYPCAWLTGRSRRS